MRRIQVNVSLGGDITLETHGFEGATCQDASRALERALARRPAATSAARPVVSASFPLRF